MFEQDAVKSQRWVINSRKASREYSMSAYYDNYGNLQAVYGLSSLQ